VLLEIKNLKKHFTLDKQRTVHAVDGVNLNVKAGTVVGLVGESGSGKSTLGRTIVGLEQITSGEIRFDGEVLPSRYRASDFRRLRSAIQMIFQDPFTSLNPRLTVGEIIAEPLGFDQQMSANDKRERVAEWLQRVGLRPEYMTRYPHEFSGGQRQRVGIARALVMEPQLLICDEPISALDVSVQAQIVNLLNKLRKDLGLTLLFIAHDLPMVHHIADRIAVMYLGSLMELGDSSEVFNNPRHPYTRALIEASPQPDPRLERKREHLLLEGEIPSPVNPPAGCRFAERCPEVMSRCREQKPQLIARDGGHQVACHLYTTENPSD